MGGEVSPSVGLPTSLDEIVVPDSVHRVEASIRESDCGAGQPVHAVRTEQSKLEPALLSRRLLSHARRIGCTEDADNAGRFPVVGPRSDAEQGAEYLDLYDGPWTLKVVVRPGTVGSLVSLQLYGGGCTY